MKLLILAKLAFSTALLVLFLRFFGLPSWAKFQAGEVMTNRRMLRSNDSIAPALTICALDRESKQGWKYEERIPKQMKNANYLVNFCNGTKQVVKCVNSNTYNLRETVVRAKAMPSGMESHKKEKDFANSKHWIEELSAFRLGKCHTLNNSVTLKSALWDFGFNMSFKYAVIIHDPNFYLFSTNPVTVPHIVLDLKKDDGTSMLYVEAIQHVNIDRPNQPCEERQKYSFTACVKNSVSKKIGCRFQITFHYYNIRFCCYSF